LAFILISSRLRCSAKLRATVEVLYKLMAEPTALGHREAIATTPVPD
jgi:hypothetical protein